MKNFERESNFLQKKKKKKKKLTTAVDKAIKLKTWSQTSLLNLFLRKTVIFPDFY
jgi:hypothetical protein